ncbi:LysR family transcriptional regulator [Rhodovibrionaceae bacterium A322]
MEFKLSLLRVFVAVAETGNIQDAADRVGRSPSAVSMSLKQVEEIVGGPLFESDRKNGLTELGRYLLQTAQGQLTALDRSMESIRAFAKGEIGRVEVACVPSVATQLMPTVIRRFQEQWRGVELDIRDIDTMAVVRAIERGTVELGIAGRPRTGAVTFQPLFTDQLVLACPQNHPLARSDTAVGWAEIDPVDFIANGITAVSDIAEVQALNGGAKLMVRNTTSLIAMVSANVGLTILPELALATPAPGVHSRPLSNQQSRREVGVIRKTESALSPAARAFLQVFNDVLKDRMTRRDGGLLSL